MPGFQWDSVILVARNHELTENERPITLEDLAQFPLVSYVFSFECDETLKCWFADAGHEANIAFTARDSDVIKTYAGMGLGIGIIAGMVCEPSDAQSLVALLPRVCFPAAPGLACGATRCCVVSWMISCAW